jgi:ATP-dependent Clp protease ATP-binding subunit ClpB
VDGDVPVKDKIVFSLDMGALIAGAKGEFEERLKSVVKVTAAEGDIVLLLMRFTLVGAGGGMDAGKYFELWLVENCALLVQPPWMNTKRRKKALERRFQNNYRRTRYRKQFQSAVSRNIHTQSTNKR